MRRRPLLDKPLTDKASAATIPQSRRVLAGPLLLFLLVLLVLAGFSDGLVEMERVWREPEYSHGYLIPFLAAYLFVIRGGRMLPDHWRPEPQGLVLLVLAFGGLLVGELSALFVIVQYSFLLAVFALALMLVGWPGVRKVWASLAILAFLIPLPRFIHFNLSADLQLMSSVLGAEVLRLVGVPVHLEGNVIDLGLSKLQVVEACSGLRYLFPLMTFGFICGYLFRGPLWQRWLIFLSAVPITIVMNSVRIAITGIIYDKWGIGAGDDFLHFFEGWVIFVACLLLLFGEMAILSKLGGKKLDDILDVEWPDVAQLRGLGAIAATPRLPVAAVVLATAGLAASAFLADREEIVPQRLDFTRFPLALGDWRGREDQLTSAELDTLQLSDYLLGRYVNQKTGVAVSLYVAYYDSQSKGASVHSPRACLPGGGWRIYSHDVAEVADIGPQGEALPVNRTLIGMGESRMMVYYWFMQRGRDITNEYLVKWFIFQDGITMRRTDGALVRLMVPLPDATDERIAEADATLAEFLRLAYPRLAYHIPQRDAVAAAPRVTNP